MTREETIATLKANYPDACFEQLRDAVDTAISVLKQPEIVRCKECKHWMPYDWMFSEVWRSKDIDDYSEDEIGCAYCDMNMGANDFCSRGERRADGFD